MNPTDKDLHPKEDSPLSPNFREYLPNFIESAREHIDAINQGLLHFEKEGSGDSESLSRISRNAHSLKGAAMTMGLANIVPVPPYGRYHSGNSRAADGFGSRNIRYPVSCK